MKTCLVVMILLPALTGCETTAGRQRRLADTRLLYDVDSVRTDVQQLTRRIEGMEAEQEHLNRQLDDLHAALEQANAQRLAEAKAMAERMDAVTQDQGRLRHELAEDLSGRIANMMRTQADARSPGGRAQTGYVHVVKPGETLSEIAREYRVRSDAIIQANRLENPDTLRVGQELFIPE